MGGELVVMWIHRLTKNRLEYFSVVMRDTCNNMYGLISLPLNNTPINDFSHANVASK